MESTNDVASPKETQKSGRSFLQNNGLIIGLVLVSMFLQALPIIRMVLLPFEFFTTFIHEGGHTLACLLVGVPVEKIVINPDTSGYTMPGAGSGRLAFGFIASAGYIGAALFGGLLIVLSARKQWSKILLGVIGVLFITGIIFYVRDFFTLAVCGLLSLVLLYVAVKASENVNYFFLNFLAVQCALNSFGDVITLVKLSLGAPRSMYSLAHSDADHVAQYFFLPAIVWSLLWVAISIGILYKAMHYSSRVRTAALNRPAPQAQGV